MITPPPDQSLQDHIDKTVAWIEAHEGHRAASLDLELNVRLSTGLGLARANLAALRAMRDQQTALAGAA